MVWRVRRSRTVSPVRPARTGTHEGLAFALWLPPDRAASGGIVVLHGAGSCKENHYDFARAAISSGYAALSFDQRGHGESEGPMDGRAIGDVVSMATLLRRELGRPDAPIALRGSSMGGYLALQAAAGATAGAVVAICPPSAGSLLRGLRGETLQFDADIPALEQVLRCGDLRPVIEALAVPVLLLHARGDERVGVEHSRELAAALRSPASRLIEIPGGHHRSIQHDGELQAVSLRFVREALRLG
jgi:alpha-beta hydrolase superfamily lysophospholipase